MFTGLWFQQTDGAKKVIPHFIKHRETKPSGGTGIEFDCVIGLVAESDFPGVLRLLVAVCRNKRVDLIIIRKA